MIDPAYVYSRVGLYKVKLTIFNKYGCNNSIIKGIMVYPVPYSSFTITSDYQGIQGKTHFQNQSIFATHYEWDFGNGNTSTSASPIEMYEEDSLYTVTLIAYNEYKCTDTAILEHKIFFKGLYIPNAFSPNNPNDEISKFSPKGINLKVYHIEVFDTKGNILWESDKIDIYGSPTESWDGYYDGNLMPEGFYLWKAMGIFKDNTYWKGSDFNSKDPKTFGTVTIIR
ncbi:MAG: gliding motility-associated C-terminal domain-containing protein [Bacteroidales bacterium]|nr:gliding motility-associated C-terminal domain-containing protein [Bacteroidales bacterium]